MAENVFEVVKQSVSTRDAAAFYGIEVKRNGMACRCPSGGTGKEKVRHGAAEKPAQGRTQKDSAQKECGKGDLIWETLLLRK